MSEPPRVNERKEGELRNGRGSEWISGSGDLSDAALGRLDAKGRVTIPKSLRERLDLSEGDTVLFRIARGRLEAVPLAMVPRDQAWFYEPETQRRVAEAHRDVAEGRTTRLESRRELEERLSSPEEVG